MCVQTTFSVKDLEGRSIVSLADGIKVGSVKDLLFSEEQLVVTDLLVSGESGLGRIPLENIKEIGPDAVMIASSQEVLWATSKASFPGRKGKELLGLTVLDSTGNVVGSLHEMELLDFQVVALDVRSGGVLGLGTAKTRILASEIQGVGPKLITVVRQAS